MLKQFIVVTSVVALISGAALAQTTTAPPAKSPPSGSGSRPIGAAPKSAEPVTPGTSTTPPTERPNDAQKMVVVAAADRDNQVRIHLERARALLTSKETTVDNSSRYRQCLFLCAGRDVIGLGVQ